MYLSASCYSNVFYIVLDYNQCMLSVCYHFNGIFKFDGMGYKFEIRWNGLWGLVIVEKRYRKAPHDNNQYAFIVSRSYLNMGNKNSKS